MTRFCPVCGVNNEDSALNCQCGRVLTHEAKALQSPAMVDPRSYRRNRILKKASGLFGATIIVLISAAYFGGVFPMQGSSDIEEEPEIESTVAVSQPLASSPVDPELLFPPSAAPPRVFPEGNVPYKASRAITGAVIAVVDSGGEERRVTLFGIRVPKLDENFGIESKEKLWTLIANKPLTIKRLKYTKEVDTIAEVSFEGSNVGLEHLRSGLALLAAEEVAGLPAAEQQQYLAAAHSARQGKFGIWSGKVPASVQSMPNADARAQSNDPTTSETIKPGQRRRTSETSFDIPNFVYEPPPRDAPSVSEAPAKPKEQIPTDEPRKETTSAPAKVVATPSAGGRKYVRGPFGGCYYMNSGGNKSYVDRSKCE